MSLAHGPIGVGIGWRPEIAGVIDALPGLGFVEVIAESLPATELPDGLVRLRQRGVRVIAHGIGLSLGGADAVRPDRVALLARCALQLDAPLVSEHIAFVRAGDIEAGHLLPVPRSHEALDALVANVQRAQDGLPVPLAVENVAALFEWPEADFTESEFLAELVERTGVLLLIDVANLYANSVNAGRDPFAELARLPLENLAYCHVAGGEEIDGLYHDTHSAPVPTLVLDLAAALAERCRAEHRSRKGFLLERDGHYPPAEELVTEFVALQRAVTDTIAARHEPR